MADVGEACCTELRLGLGYHCSRTNNKLKKDHDVIDNGSKRRDDSSMVSLGLSFTVSSEEDEEKEEQDQTAVTALAPKNPKICGSNVVVTGNCDGDNLDVGCRKKLRLSKDQSALLEETFKQHRTLTPAKKRALADQLDLKPRQVEIWFQNRRARSKLKQIELDFEQLKKENDGLSDKNRRLEKELHDLRSERSSSASAQPAPDSNPAASLICSSCRKTMAAAERD